MKRREKIFLCFVWNFSAKEDLNHQPLRFSMYKSTSSDVFSETLKRTPRKFKILQGNGFAATSYKWKLFKVKRKKLKKCGKIFLCSVCNFFPFRGRFKSTLSWYFQLKVEYSPHWALFSENAPRIPKRGKNSTKERPWSYQI